MSLRHVDNDENLLFLPERKVKREIYIGAPLVGRCSVLFKRKLAMTINFKYIN